MARKDDEFLLGRESATAGRKTDQGKGTKIRVPKGRRGESGASKKARRGGGARQRGGRGNRSTGAERLALAKGAKQAIPKVTGNSRSHDHAVQHALYLSRQGSLTVENDRGEEIKGRDRVIQEIELWDLPKEEGRRRDDYHIMLGSLPPDFPREKAMQLAQQFTDEHFSEYPHLIAVHKEPKHTHVHLQVRTRDWGGGNAIQLTRKKTRELREAYAKLARKHGVLLAAATRTENARAHPSIEASAGHAARERGNLTAKDRREIRAAADRLIRQDFGLRDEEMIAYARRGSALKAYHDDLKLMKGIAMETQAPEFRQSEKELKAWTDRLATEPVVPSREIHWMIKLVEARTRLMAGERRPEDLAINRVTEKELGDARHFAQPTKAQLKSLLKLRAPESAMRSRRKAGEFIRLSRSGKADQYEDTRFGKEHEPLLDALRGIGDKDGVSDALELHRHFPKHLAKNFQQQAMKFMRLSIEQAPDISD